MEAAVNLISKIPGDTLKVYCLVALTAVFFVPLLFIKKSKKPSLHQMLKETKMVLEIKKLVLELDEKLNTYADSSHISIRKQDTDYYENKVLNNTEENTDAAVYYNKIKCSISGSIFFFLITTTAIISAEYSMMVFEDYVAGFARDLAVCIASGFAATFIPWGSDWYYFIYGFTLPIQIATIIAILA